jgi:ribosomal protein L37AE/L43A
MEDKLKSILILHGMYGIENLDEATQQILLLFGVSDLHCPYCSAETSYDTVLGLYKCNECDWEGQK